MFESKKNKIFKSLVFLQIIFLVVPLFVNTAEADVASISNPDAFVDPITKALHESAVDVTKQALGKILEDFGMGDEAFENIGEMANVMENKRNAPEVQLMFSPSAPRVAEKITATALPKYFQQDKSNLYFTWYLKHEECAKAKKGSEKYVAKCDLNNDDEVDVEDWKIEAMREIAKGGFDRNKADYIIDPEDDPDEDGFSGLENYAQSGLITDETCDELSIGFDNPLPRSECGEGIGTDENISDLCDKADDFPNPVCTKTPFGGTNAKQPTDGFRCYVNDYSSGVIYEIVENSTAKRGLSGCTVTVDGESGIETSVMDDGSPVFRFSKKGGDYSANPTVEISDCDNGIDDYSESFPNPGNDPDCHSAPGDLVGRYRLGDGSLWKGNSESDCKLAMVLSPNYTEDIEDEDESEDEYSDSYHHWNSNAWEDTSVVMVLCDDSPEMDSCTVTSSLGTQALSLHGDRDNEGYGCREHWWLNMGPDSTMFDGPQTVTCIAKTGGTYKYVIPDGDEGGNPLIPGFEGIVFDDATCSCEEEQQNDPKDSICEHLFPHATDKDGEVKFTTGDGIFTTEEEDFWGTNPNDADTNGDGTGDEASIAGVGQDRFTWTYDSGDLVGVAVEGNSVNPTKHADSSYMVMWALPKNEFNIDSECKIKNKGKYTKTINGRDVEIETAETDINACLEENLIDPTEDPQGSAGTSENLEVDLIYSPAKPFNDAEGANGSNIVVQSTINNSGTNDSRDIYYNWNVYGKSDTDFMGDWGESIIGDLGIGITQGLNKESISFSLNLEEGSAAHTKIFNGGSQGYIKVKLEVEENYDSGMTKGGSKEKIIKVSTGLNNKINVFEAEYDGSGLTLDSSVDSDKRLCLSSDEGYCPVVKNMIIGAKLDTGLLNFSWTLNGKPIECNKGVSSLCSNDVQGDTVFFSIDGKEGEIYTLTALANDVSTDPAANNKGERTEITQIFKVVDPAIELGPEGGIDDECSGGVAGFDSKYMGDYKDIRNDGALIKECSDDKFIGQSGTFNIQAVFTPAFMGKHIKEEYEKIENDTDLSTDEKITKKDNLIKLTIDGEKVEDISFDEEGKMTAQYDASALGVGENISVSVSGSYTQSREIKRILNNVFKISQLNFSDSKMSDTISIKIEEASSVGIRKSTKTMASLLSNVPTQMLFLMRMILTIGIVIFISGTVLSLGKQKL